jgi:UDP-glucose 4-epimerase
MVNTIKEIVNNFNIILKYKNLKTINYEFVNNRVGDIPISFANVDKINKELNWFAIKDINSMLNDTLEYYINI